MAVFVLFVCLSRLYSLLILSPDEESVLFFGFPKRFGGMFFLCRFTYAPASIKTPYIDRKASDPTRSAVFYAVIPKIISQLRL